MSRFSDHRVAGRVAEVVTFFSSTRRVFQFNVSVLAASAGEMPGGNSRAGLGGGGFRGRTGAEENNLSHFSGQLVAIFRSICRAREGNACRFFPISLSKITSAGRSGKILPELSAGGDVRALRRCPDPRGPVRRSARRDHSKVVTLGGADRRPGMLNLSEFSR